MNIKPELILVRGIPGSGKSTFVKNKLNTNLWAAFKHFEADMYHIDLDTNTYIYNPANLELAHEWCFNNTIHELNHGYSVFVSNTFVKLWEMQKYLDNWDNVRVFKCDGNYKGVHNTPEEVIQRMRDTWEDYPDELLI